MPLGVYFMEFVFSQAMTLKPTTLSRNDFITDCVFLLRS